MTRKPRSAIDAFLDDQEIDPRSQEYAQKVGNTAINRPLLSWDRPLGDASWRRWFDTVKAQGVTGFTPGAGKGKAPLKQSLAIDTLLGGEPHTGPVNPDWTTTRSDPYAVHRNKRLLRT